MNETGIWIWSDTLLWIALVAFVVMIAAILMHVVEDRIDRRKDS